MCIKRSPELKFPFVRSDMFCPDPPGHMVPFSAALHIKARVAGVRVLTLERRKYRNTILVWVVRMSTLRKHKYINTILLWVVRVSTLRRRKYRNTILLWGLVRLCHFAVRFFSQKYRDGRVKTSIGGTSHGLAVQLDYYAENMKETGKTIKRHSPTPTYPLWGYSATLHQCHHSGAAGSSGTSLIHCLQTQKIPTGHSLNDSTVWRVGIWAGIEVSSRYWAAVPESIPQKQLGLPAPEEPTHNWMNAADSVVVLF